MKNKYKKILMQKNEKIARTDKTMIILYIIGEIGWIIFSYGSSLYLHNFIDINTSKTIVRGLSVVLCLIYLINIIWICRTFFIDETDFFGLQVENIIIYFIIAKLIYCIFSIVSGYSFCYDVFVSEINYY